MKHECKYSNASNDRGYDLFYDNFFCISNIDTIGVTIGDSILNLVTDYVSILTFRLMKMRETGLMVKWKQKHWPSNAKARCGPKRKLTSASMSDVQGIFVVFAFFLFLASVMLIFEIITNKHHFCIQNKTF